ncbi:MAG TPA: hypothetical protein VGQ52_21200 [Gemmatimonadaceae bacterium]|nr:hypothetical protein [Gemmatimonadaceae bacterium]
MTELSAWLDGAATRVFALCAILFVALNVGAVMLVVMKRDRAMVNRWTARWLAANFALLGAGLGMPLAAKVVHATVDAFSASRTLTSPPTRETESEPQPQPARR